MLEPAQSFKWLTLVYASTLILLIVTADRGALAIRWLAGLPAGDKIGHFVLIGFLAYLVNAALGARRWRWRRLSILKGSLLVGALVLAEEISQLWLIHRAFELADLVADAAGIWASGWLVHRPRTDARPATQ